MNKPVATLLELPFILFGKIVDFFVWDVFSDGKWRERHVYHTNPAGFYMNQNGFLRSQLREKEIEHQRDMAALRRKHRQELDALRRQNRHPGR